MCRRDKYFYKGVSKPVNEELTRLFIRLDLMEQTGHGVPLVVSRYGREVFEFMDFFIKVTIPFAFELSDETWQNGPKDDPKDDPKETSERQKVILGLIKKDPSITRECMTQKMSVSEATIKRELADLQKKGILTREGGRKDGRWVIIDFFESK